MAPKNKKKHQGDDEEEEVVMEAVQETKSKNAKSKSNNNNGKEEKPVAKASKSKKRNQGDSDSEEEQNTAGGAAKPAETGGLSKTALLKAKRDAKKNKNGAQPSAAAAASAAAPVVEEDEEPEEEEEPVVDHDLVEQIKNLALEEVIEEMSEDEERVLKAEKKKEKKSKEKKKLAKASHGILEVELPPTPPPQPPLPDLVDSDEEEEEAAPVEEKPAKTSKKKKKGVVEEEEEEKPAKASKKKKKEAALEEEEEDDSEGEEEEEEPKAKEKSRKSKKNDEEVEEEEEKKSKKRTSNKERRKEKDLAAAAAAEEVGPGDQHAHPDNKVFAVSATSVNLDDDKFKQARDISIPSFSISTSGKTLFNNAELRIAQGRRYGFVGPNGLGKSVLLRAIANRDLPIPPLIDCLYVEQEVIPSDDLAVDVVLSADARRSFLIRREQELMQLIDNEAQEASDEVHEEYIQVCDELRTSKAEAAEAKALNLLRGLGFSDEMARMPTKHLSGGWRMRVSIAKGLFIEPTLLLLDEPTNHLDLEAVIFLESVLSKWEKTLVVVSHDVGFLDEVCQEIIHLDSQKLWYYKGNYSKFEEQFKVETERRKRDYEKHLKQVKEDQKMGMKLTNRERENKKKREAGASKQKRGKGGGNEEEEQVAIAAAGKNRGQKDSNKMDRPKDYVVKFSFPPPSELTPPIIQVRDVDFQYGANTPRLFHQLNFGIDMDSRICIVGPNGSGKSTLIGLLTQSLVPTEGEILCNRHVRIAVYRQHFVDSLPLNLTPVEYLQRKHNCEMQDCRGRLGRYGLPGSAHTIPLRSLSGGQKARVVFADMSYQNPHIIIADEPSNNLDMESIRALGEAINEFAGGVVLVSHDARLIEETGMNLWVVENEQVVLKDLDTYRGEILLKLEKKERDALRIANEKQFKREQQVKALKQAREEKLAAKAAAAAVAAETGN